MLRRLARAVELAGCKYIRAKPLVRGLDVIVDAGRARALVGLHSSCVGERCFVRCACWRCESAGPGGGLTRSRVSVPFRIWISAFTHLTYP